MDSIHLILKLYWGYDSLLPLQDEAMDCVLKGRDSIVVLPTGGGKSLCFQVPALIEDKMCLVVSPLISLMKDQVDALNACGIEAACINSSMSSEQQRRINERAREGKLKLLYLSPERLVSDIYMSFLQECNLTYIAIDEAHCISAWGHDFRPEYRMLSVLKDKFNGIPIHAYTATATEKVRNDIANQLNLNDPEIIVGSFDRPNLIYSVKRAEKSFEQTCTVIDRHPNESGIIYCISRKSTEELSHRLTVAGYNARPYHAGMDPMDRRRNQEDFIHERVDIIIATVAFGMGIDKSNVRYVIHNGMPKSIEHYIQESGRAGRDGLPSECLLIFSGSDLRTWKYIMSELEPKILDAAVNKLYEMYDYCNSVQCRHKTLVAYFSQDFRNDNCEACDICLDGVELADDSLIIGQKILSCVKRLDERFGADHVSKVLAGSKSQRILQFDHDDLSTHGILKEYKPTQIRNWIEQLVSLGYLIKGLEYNTLSVSDVGWKLIRGEEKPKLLKAFKPTRSDKAETRVSKVESDSWEDVDRELFNRLRILRREIAEEKNVPAFIIFSDVSLRDMARKKPLLDSAFQNVYGVGKWKANEYGKRFMQLIKADS